MIKKSFPIFLQILKGGSLELLWNTLPIERELEKET